MLLDFKKIFPTTGTQGHAPETIDPSEIFMCTNNEIVTRYDKTIPIMPADLDALQKFKNVHEFLKDAQMVSHMNLTCTASEAKKPEINAYLETYKFCK